MIRVKFRNPKTRKFEYWTNVPENYIRAISHKLIPDYSQPAMQFWISNPTPRILPQEETRELNAIILNISYPSYYIEGGMLFSEVAHPDLASLIRENITHFRLLGHPWQPIANIWLGNSGIVSYDDRVFSPLSAMHFVDYLIPGRDNIQELEEKSLDELKTSLKFTEMMLI